jgi:alkaline phosphatase D
VKPIRGGLAASTERTSTGWNSTQRTSTEPTLDQAATRPKRPGERAEPPVAEGGRLAGAAVRLSRRGFVIAGFGGVAALAAACSSSGSAGPSTGHTLAPAKAVPGVRDGVFSLGVASGDPLPDAVIIWTRLAMDPLHGGGMPDKDIPVDWQVANDEAFADVVKSGTAVASPGLAHSLHVDVHGLSPAREYYYRFRAGTVLSPVGRTKTAPAADAANTALSLALVSCQDYQNGYWPAFTAIAADHLDLVVHVGDYIYEGDPNSRFPDRRHTTPQTPGLGELRTLADYRDRYAQYKMDPALQAAHVASPWAAVWDDHEVQNNYAGLTQSHDENTGRRAENRAAFGTARAAAYQAYYEHMPIRAQRNAGSDSMQIYRQLNFGTLASLNLLDTRQYRTPQPGSQPQDIGPARYGEDNTAGTMTGPAQEAWLVGNLKASRARWNIIAQQTMMAQLHATASPGGPILANLDQVDGYVPYRTRLLTEVRDSKATNPVVLSGDIHCAWVNDLRVDFDKPETPAVATEFVCTSISSSFFLVSNDFVRDANKRYNPHVKYFRGDKRGYTRIRVTPETMTGDMRIVDSIDTRTSPASTDASYVIENGKPGAVRA